MRRKIMAVIGGGSGLSAALEASCVELGRAAIDAGFRVATGGRGGVMEAVSRGAHESAKRHDGDVLGILPGYDAEDANRWVDIVIPTGIGLARNVVLVSTADVVVAVGGGSGTLSEMALAWQLGKPVIGLDAPGWSGKLAGSAIDDRRDDLVHHAATASEAIALASGFTV